MSLEIVNDDFIITITPNGAWNYGTPTYTIFPCTKVKVNTKFALIWHIIWQMLNKDCTLAGYTFVMGGGMIFPTGNKCFTAAFGAAENPLRRTDWNLCNGSFTKDSDGSPLACTCNFEITFAGQIKARCN